MMMRSSRRRFLSIVACSAALAGGPLPALGAVLPKPKFYIWKGEALGADASMQLWGDNQQKAHELMRACFTEVSRLEKIFSLYNDSSELCLLNKQGYFLNPSVELVELLEISHGYSELTSGAFDVTVQPLWDLYTSNEALSSEQIESARASVGYRHVEISKREIRFTKRGMAITLNGIAQGYITDKVSDLLRHKGLEHVLVDMGEMRAIGSHPKNRPWSLGIKHPDHPRQIIDRVQLNENALATSASYGSVIDSKIHHLFDPHTGKSTNYHRSVSVMASTATQADALSTAFSAMPEASVHDVVKSQQDVSVIII